MKEGYFLNGDSAYFDKYVEQMKTGMDRIIKKEVKKYNGYPALYLDALYQRNVVFKTMHVIRGSRVYSLLVGGQSVVGSSEPDTYFNSFKMDDYPVSEWKMYAADGFSTSAPSVITRLKTDSTNEAKASRQCQYVSYNSNEVISYVIIKEPLPVYYWAKNDSSFFETRTSTYRKEGDSILKRELTWNGQLRALDLLIQKPQSNNLQKVRLLVSKDTLYTLAAFIPSQDIGRANHQRFFHDFKIDSETAPVIYTKKANELLNALQSRDSLQFDKALQSFNAVKFSKEDLPALQKALLEVYNDSASYNGVQNKIMSYVEEFADPSTISFVATNYKTLPPGKECIQYPLLEVLANIHTQPAYNALKQLLLNQLPGQGSSASLEYSLSDSLQLTRSLYPDILKLSSDSIFSKVLVSITDQLLDSNLIQLADVLPYRAVFVQQARKDLLHLKKDQDQWWQYSSWISFLGKFDNKESNNLLQEFLKLPVSGIKMEAVKALARNGQVIPANEIEKLAIDKNFRVNLYHELKVLNKQHLFPVAYARQQSLGESEIYQIASDEYEVGATQLIGERTRTYQGKKKKFYLYKITLNLEEGKKESYLGVTGPYDPNAKELISFSDASGIYWDEQFDKLKTDEQLKAFIEQQEPSKK
jgi:HEAT repeat protein